MKRRLITLLIFLLLGAIVNIAMAWGCAAWSPLPVGFTPTPMMCPDGWPPYLEGSWPAPAAARERVPVGQGIGSIGVTIIDVESAKVLSSGGDAITSAWLTVYRFGIPVRSMQWEEHRLNAGERSIEFLRAAADAAGWRTGIRISGTKPGVSRRRLPLTAIWPGFAINTLFYAAIVWLLFALPGVLRRWRRIKRGLCPACAYPVGTSDLCTECGKPIPDSLRGSTPGLREGVERTTSNDGAKNDASPTLPLPLPGGGQRLADVAASR